MEEGHKKQTGRDGRQAGKYETQREMLSTSGKRRLSFFALIFLILGRLN